ncbi:MAG TPA: aldo/keto reductase [Sedimentisphaerales bacterium]|nr:aldo/keto reductase [Sedimentisphaerales bacterium]
MISSRIKISPEGPEFSRMTHGLWRLKDWDKSPVEIQEMIHSCLQLGITTFDHADIYGDYNCESLFGAALAESSVRRANIELVTKCGIKLVSKNRPETSIKHYDTSVSHILDSVEKSLKNLRTDYVDLLLIHRPDPLMNAEEVGEAFSRLKESGKVLHFGVSNFLPSQFKLLSSQTDVPLVTNQIEFSVLNMEAQDNGIMDMCQRLRISPMAWSPLGGGTLFHENTERIVRLRQVLKDIEDELGAISIDQVALAWILNHPADFVVILGTGNLDRIRRAVEAEQIKLSREQWFMIWRASMDREVP